MPGSKPAFNSTSKALHSALHGTLHGTLLGLRIAQGEVGDHAGHQAGLQHLLEAICPRVLAHGAPQLSFQLVDEHGQWISCTACGERAHSGVSAGDEVLIFVAQGVAGPSSGGR